MTGQERLCTKTLDRLPANVSRPAYDREKIDAGIVHIGVGAFHKGHQAVYTDDALAEAGGDWGIAGVSLRRPDARNQLEPQDGLYIVGARDGDGEERRLIGALKTVHTAPEDPGVVVRLLADPKIRIVTLTITEKGYCLDPQSGELDVSAPEIAHDLKSLDEPRSAVGFLAASFAARKKQNLSAPAIVACDNLSHNGEKLKRAVLEFAGEVDPSLAAWITDEVDFPSTMVDRIVPATTEDDIKRLAGEIGLYDAAYVKTEPFRQWVIENAFRSERPRWEAGGAQFVSDVAPYELMKLRLLNGPHSAMAYLGYLAGKEYISDVVADPVFDRFILELMTQEIIPTMPKTPGVDLHYYIGELRKRFANPALKHRTWQIAMDGSQKLPQRLTDVVRARLDQGLPIDRLALAIAAWMRYVGGVDEKGRPIDVQDPLADKLKKLYQSGDDARGRVTALLSVEQVFGTDLPKAARFVDAAAAQLASLEAVGAANTVKALQS